MLSSTRLGTGGHKCSFSHARVPSSSALDIHRSIHPQASSSQVRPQASSATHTHSESRTCPTSTNSITSNVHRPANADRLADPAQSLHPPPYSSTRHQHVLLDSPRCRDRLHRHGQRPKLLHQRCHQRCPRQRLIRPPSGVVPRADQLLPRDLRWSSIPKHLRPGKCSEKPTSPHDGIATISD